MSLNRDCLDFQVLESVDKIKVILMMKYGHIRIVILYFLTSNIFVNTNSTVN